jgi:hypothetical protein
MPGILESWISFARVSMKFWLCYGLSTIAFQRFLAKFSDMVKYFNLASLSARFRQNFG